MAEARAHFERGRAAYQEGRLELALEQLRKAYELMPSPELEFDLARVYERMGEVDAAVRHYQSYLANHVKDAAERAQIEARLRELQALLARRQAQIKAAPPSSAALTAEARTFFERGLKLFARRKYEAALLAFAAARSFARLPELAYNMALTAERLGRRSEAVDHYRTYLREADGADDRARVQARVKSLLAEPAH